MDALSKVRWVFFLTVACGPGLFAKEEAQGTTRKILVFGGNGLLGSSTVEKLLAHGDDVTIVNRGNWYWDSKDRIKPRVHVVHCDRKQVGLIIISIGPLIFLNFNKRKSITKFRISAHRLQVEIGRYQTSIMGSKSKKPPRN